jgi:hypothetical protein
VAARLSVSRANLSKARLVIRTSSLNSSPSPHDKQSLSAKDTPPTTLVATSDQTLVSSLRRARREHASHPQQVMSSCAGKIQSSSKHARPNHQHESTPARLGIYDHFQPRPKDPRSESLHAMRWPVYFTKRKTPTTSLPEVHAI